MVQQLFDFGVRTTLGRSDFLCAPSNAEAVSWLDRWPAWPGTALVLYGPTGSGKTHLAHIWCARAGAALLPPHSLDTERLPEMLGTAAVAAVDDAEAADAEALLHLFNLLAERKGHLLVLSRGPPARWTSTLADLRSRLVAAPTIALVQPDDALLAAVMMKLFADRQIVVARDVVDYVVARLERTFAAVQMIVADLDRAALARHRPITLPLVREVLNGLGMDGTETD